MPRLLIVYDGTESAAAAIACAAEMFPGAEAVIAHMQDVTAAGGRMDPAATAQDPAAAGTRAAARAGADEGVALATGAGLRATGVPVASAGGSAVPAVVAEIADEHAATVIVVSTDGRSRLHSAVTGSGATGILSRSTLPVLVVPRSG